MFSVSALDLSLEYSFITLTANFINIIFVVIAEAYLVEKANRCLDFSLTIFFLHLLLTWGVNKFPWQLNWWLWQAAIVTITTLLSEFVCLRLETAEIKISINHIIEKGKEVGKMVG
mmetsp:Transcript_1328/g.1362  ORF Transcript_1328/g.1362 Transcript_1328/m.1362 type:complete len:116 (+) Transcript_1328:257-604(+)